MSSRETLEAIRLSSEGVGRCLAIKLWKISFVPTFRTPTKGLPEYCLSGETLERPLYPVSPVVLVERPASHERRRLARDRRQAPPEGVGSADGRQRRQLPLARWRGGGHPSRGRHARRGRLADAHYRILEGNTDTFRAALQRNTSFLRR